MKVQIVFITENHGLQKTERITGLELYVAVVTRDSPFSPLYAVSQVNKLKIRME
jgi:hypothetical protein